MFYGKVGLSGVNTSSLPTLSDEEKRELLTQSRRGDREAREKLIDGNLRLVLSIVKRYGSRSDSPDDLFQVGCIGLIKAIDNFNTDLDVKFSTYAVPMIVGEVKRYLRDNTTLRVSRSLRDLAYRSLNARERLARETGHEPSLSEIAALLRTEGEEHTEAEIGEALEAITSPVSLFDPVSHSTDGGDTLSVMDQIRDENEGEDRWLENIALREAMRSLSPREKKILSLRFYRGRTQTEIAQEIGISQAQVSRLEKAALEEIRKRM